MPNFYFSRFDFHPKPLSQAEQDARVIRAMAIRIAATLIVLTCCAIPVLIMVFSR